MRKNFKSGASTVGEIIGVVVIILVLLLGAYYFWNYKIQPRLNTPDNNASSTISTTTVNVQVSATTT